MSSKIGADAISCPAACAPSVSLTEALRRWEREAVHGTCNTGRYRCSYSIWGNGPPLVFIHGLSDTSRSFVQVMARLVERFRCLAYELPTGQGDGARLGRYTHALLVEDLFALLDHLGLERCYLYGSSFGSTIALAALHRQPRRFPRGVLQGGFARRPLAPAELLLASLARYWPWPLRALPLRETVLVGDDRGPFRAAPPEVWRYYLDNSGAIPMAAIAHRALLLQRLDLRPLLPRIGQPILMVCGDRDPAVSRTCEEVLLRGLPCVTRVELQGCGHFPYFTHPEPLAYLIGSFLTPPAAVGVPAVKVGA